MLPTGGFIGMGVSTTGESGETFPNRILTLEIYWGISPVKIRFRPKIDPLIFNVLFFVHKIRLLPKKWAKSADFSVFGRGEWGP